MTKMMPKGVLALLLLTAGCDFFAKRDLSREREDVSYKAAMEDYRAGNVVSAVEGFQKTVRENPANTSARFQLACLLQDVKHDYEGAYCAYREFLMQFAESEKAGLAKQRLAQCEKELARTLAARYGLDSAVVMQKQCEHLRDELKVARERNAKLDADFAQAMQRIAALRQENTRLIGAMRGMDEGSEKPSSAVAKDAMAALRGMDEGMEKPSPAVATDAKRLIEAEEGETDRVKASADIANLRREGEEELASALRAPLPQALDAKEQRAAREEAAAKAKEAERQARKNLEPPHEKRPATYIVSEGDTLIRIAIRFYGRPSAWKKIREANKAVVSTDGRVKVGDKLVFPDPEK